MPSKTKLSVIAINVIFFPAHNIQQHKELSYVNKVVNHVNGQSNQWARFTEAY